jgi:hypothetical protein
MDIGTRVKRKSSEHLGTIIGKSSALPEKRRVEFWNPEPRWDFDVETFWVHIDDLEPVE